MKLTLYWPFGSRFTLPATNAFAPFAFHAPKSTDAVSGTGVLPASTLENLPLRARSPRTTDVTCCGRLASLTKFAVAIGNWVEPTPVIRTFTCAWAAPPAAIRHEATSALKPSFVIKLMLLVPVCTLRNRRDSKIPDSFPVRRRECKRKCAHSAALKVIVISDGVRPLVSGGRGTDAWIALMTA